ncbi:MAG TPA: hypothetical protein DEH78_30575 [Solibacterales bacterium]|nr:hypothetical protein [Bryobacterales bacterium]
MSSQSDLARLRLADFVERFRGQMIPLSGKFAYFPASLPLTGEDIDEYLQEPIAALPPAMVAELPPVNLLLAPHLERNGGKGQKAGDAYITAERPAESKAVFSAELMRGGESFLAFAIQEQEVADYHYRFYHGLAKLISQRWNGESQMAYSKLLREELCAGVHGEVDEQSWHLKQGLVRRQVNLRRETKGFQEYAVSSFIDTLTLYLHGICCDIDVETGPRQLPSRYLRRRLDLLYGLYPPPAGYAVFPEDLSPPK